MNNSQIHIKLPTQPPKSVVMNKFQPHPMIVPIPQKKHVVKQFIKNGKRMGIKQIPKPIVFT